MSGFALEPAQPGPCTFPQTDSAFWSVGTIKLRLFVSELRNLSPERVTDLFRVPQPFSERDRLKTRVPDSWSRLFKSYLCWPSGPSLMQLGQIAGESDGNLVCWLGRRLEISGPKTNTVARGASALLLPKFLGQDPKMSFFLKPHHLEQNSYVENIPSFQSGMRSHLCKTYYCVTYSSSPTLRK